MLIAAIISTAYKASTALAAPTRHASISIKSKSIDRRDASHSIKLVQMEGQDIWDHYYSMAGEDTSDTLACPTKTDVHSSWLRTTDFQGELQLWPYPTEYLQCYFKPDEKVVQDAMKPDASNGWYRMPSRPAVGSKMGSIECQKVGDYARTDLVTGECKVLEDEAVDCPADCGELICSSPKAYIGCSW